MLLCYSHKDSEKRFCEKDLGNVIDGRFMICLVICFPLWNLNNSFSYTENPLILKPEGILTCLHEYLKCFRARIL